MKFYVYYNNETFKFELDLNETVENIKNDLLDAMLPNKIPQDGLDYLDFKLINPLNATPLKESQFLGYYYGYSEKEPYSIEIIRDKHYHDRRVFKLRSGLVKSQSVDHTNLAKSRSADYSNLVKKKESASIEKLGQENGCLEQKIRQLEMDLEKEKVWLF